MDNVCLYGWNAMENVQKKPEIIVFAGPNGSGKSTFTEILRPPQMDYINADEIKKNLKCDDLEAAQIAERQREAYLSDKRAFCFETVLSTPRNLELLKRAREKIYSLLLCLDHSPDYQCLPCKGTRGIRRARCSRGEDLCAL